MELQKIATRDLKLGDVVNLTSTDGWNTCLIKKIDHGKITLFRPYGTTTDFSYTGGVVCLVGIEEWEVPIDDCPFYTLVRRGNVK